MAHHVQIPAFAMEAWYSDPGDHRCPHDAWLESIEISEPAKGERSEVRQTSIILRLLGAYHDGWILLRYHGVRSFSLAASHSERGLGDWLQDRFVPSERGLVLHEITWAGFGNGQETEWRIEAQKVEYEWHPEAASTINR